MSDIISNIADKTGFADFAVRIENGAMVITPSDAGVAVFGHVSQAEATISDLQDLLARVQEDYEEVCDNNASLLNALEETVEIIQASFPEQAARLLNLAYPVVGIDADGNETKFDGVLYE